MSNEILRRVTVDPSHRIDIILTRKLTPEERQNLIGEICYTLQNKEFNVWKEIHKIRFAINSRSKRIDLPPMHVRMMQITVRTKPTKLSWRMPIFK